MDHDRSPRDRVPRPRRSSPLEDDDRLVEAARQRRLPDADADPAVRLLAALQNAAEVRGAREH